MSLWCVNNVMTLSAVSRIYESPPPRKAIPHLTIIHTHTLKFSLKQPSVQRGWCLHSEEYITNGQREMQRSQHFIVFSHILRFKSPTIHVQGYWTIITSLMFYCGVWVGTEEAFIFSHYRKHSKWPLWIITCCFVLDNQQQCRWIFPATWTQKTQHPVLSLFYPHYYHKNG